MTQDKNNSEEVHDLGERVKELERQLKEANSKKESQKLLEKISQLESTLTHYKDELESAKRTISDLQAPYRDIVSKLKEAIGPTGELRLQAGGYEIMINDRQLFPWNAVIDQLLESGYQVWLTRKDKSTFLCCKPPSQ